MIPTPKCPYCTTGEVETEDHLFWKRPEWETCRSQRLPDILRLARAAGLTAPLPTWPACLRVSGLPPQSSLEAAPPDTLPPFVFMLHVYMCDILEIRKIRD